MSLNNLDDLEYIEKQLIKIRETINLEDAYYICDSIVTNINDQDLITLITEMMNSMGYEETKIQKVYKIINNIQNKN